MRRVREFSNKPLSLAEVSQLFWSAYGTIDDKGLRSPLGRHTLPS